MIGDGINDAPVSVHPFQTQISDLTAIRQALTAADVGVAIGSGSKSFRRRLNPEAH
jgi:cation transport ATPase